ncbi:MAG: PIN domain-containing protein [Chloroflexota bacterium]|nr:PIN domain-containing protein [Chloroflexota bacterium]
MTNDIYLFPDTHFFFHYESPENIDWASHPDFADADNIHLLVCNPVHTELDKHKHISSDRVGRRATKYAGLLRNLVRGFAAHHEFRSENPRVVLEEANDLRPSADLELDYQVMDDRIVGCVHAYAAIHPEAEVFLLTNDGSAMASAKNQGVPFVAIPDAWRLEAPPSSLERQVAQLRRELSTARRVEPDFDISIRSPEGDRLEKINARYLAFPPLTESEIESLVGQLESKFPLQPEPLNLPHDSFASYRALSALGLDRPRRNPREYETWLDDCTNFFQTLHTSAVGHFAQPVVGFEIANVGERPATDTLVTFTAWGRFALVLPPEEVGSDDSADEDRTLKLPSPPRARTSLQDSLSVISNPYGLGGFSSLIDTDPRSNRDPNSLYYKPDRPKSPTRSIILECQQWRHESDPELFNFDIYSNAIGEEVSGRVECRVQAANLSKAASAGLSVMVDVQRGDTLDLARKLISTLIDTVSAKDE